MILNSKMDFLGELFDKKIILILQQLFSKPNHQFYLRELSKLTGVSPATTYRILFKLESLDIISVIKIAKFKAYVLNSNEIVDFLSKIIDVRVNPLQIFVDKVSLIREIEAIIQYGKMTKKQANVLLIGSYFDQLILKKIVDEIKKEYDFLISYLTLSKDQFEKMAQMGLYKDNKVVLFER